MNKLNNETLGAKLKRIRKSKSYTLEKLAELTNSSKRYLWGLEKGDTPRPSAAKLRKIAEHLGVSMEYLMGAGLSQADAEDERFYRKYQDLDNGAKSKIRAIMDILFYQGIL